MCNLHLHSETAFPAKTTSITILRKFRFSTSVSQHSANSSSKLACGVSHSRCSGGVESSTGTTGNRKVQVKSLGRSSRIPPKDNSHLFASLLLIMFAVRRALVSNTIKDVFARSKHSLPDLPYDYKALEPIISREIMELHHSKHHATYVNNLNVAEEKMREAVTKGDVNTQIALGPAIKFNGGGHLNHSIFWCNLSPNCSNPDATLTKQINEDFGSMEEMKKQLSEMTVAIQGSGWGWLGYDQKAKSLRIATCANQDPLQATTGLIPLFGIDVWEHAYYLQYKNVRPVYVQAICDIINWQDVNARFKIAIGC